MDMNYNGWSYFTSESRRKMERRLLVVKTRGGKDGFFNLFVFCFFKNQKKISKGRFFWFFMVFRILIFSYKFCAQSLKSNGYYFFIIISVFNLHEFTLVLASAA